MFYEPSKGHGLPHDPFKAIIAPRPVGWISTIDKDGAINLAPYSYFNALSAKPPLVWFSSDGEKHSATAAAETGEFVTNLVSRMLAEKMNTTSVNAPRGINEFDYAGLEMAPSRLVKPPRVAEAPASLECKVTDVYRPRGLDGSATDAFVVIGEVVGVYIDEAYVHDGLFDSVMAGNVARLGYFDYSSTDRVFPMHRPRWDADKI